MENKIRFALVAIILALGGVILNRATTGAGGSSAIIGVKIYDNHRELSGLFAEWRELGINTVVASVSLNQNEDFRRIAKQNRITRLVILPVFFDPDALKADPELHATTARGDKAIDEWVTFVCPSREGFRKRKIEYIKKIVTDVNPDGLSIDFIRHFGFWEKVYPDRTLESLPNTCFDSACIERF